MLFSVSILPKCASQERYVKEQGVQTVRARQITHFYEPGKKRLARKVKEDFPSFWKKRESVGKGRQTVIKWYLSTVVSSRNLT